jgi:hypothetical protein
VSPLRAIAEGDGSVTSQENPGGTAQYIQFWGGEFQKSYELLSDKQRAELAAEQATRETRLAHDQAARARDAVAALVAQVRSLEDHADLRDARRDLLRTATSAVDALSTRTESPTVLPTLALPSPSAAESATPGPARASSLVENVPPRM